MSAQGADKLSPHTIEWTRPAIGAVAVNINEGDHSFADRPARALYVGTSGDVALTMYDGSEAVFAGVPAGILPVSFLAVLQSGTDAEGMVALF